MKATYLICGLYCIFCFAGLLFISGFVWSAGAHIPAIICAAGSAFPVYIGYDFLRTWRLL